MMMTTKFVCEKDVLLLYAGSECVRFRERAVRTLSALERRVREIFLFFFSCFFFNFLGFSASRLRFIELYSSFPWSKESLWLVICTFNPVYLSLSVLICC